jgi:hypothetical protein
MNNHMRAILVASLVIFGALAPMSLFAWDEGYISLTVPVKVEAPLVIEPDLSVRMLQVIPPDQAAFRISDGVILFRSMKVSVSYLTNLKELSGEISGWLPFGPFAGGISAEGIWADDPANVGSRYWSGAATAFASGWIVPNVLNAAVNVQYDFFFQRLNAGLGASVSIVPDKLSIVAEAFVSALGTYAFGWDTGVLIKTAGHQFLIYVGNGNDLRMRNTLAASPSIGSVAFGLTIRRRLDIYF